ncbi:MAG: tRNA guanosine(34) transglycosylase Tgt [Archangiaceae bacterium]|nr:tRNA guanosine(34) transglycosylase Tgt [Archangiaceae bacterium]
MPLRYELLATAPGGARAGLLHTRRGVVETPTFMPVATHAGFRHHAVEEVVHCGAKILLSNTYHLLLRPGPEVFERLGGIHRFMGWQGGVLTDSGGFQIFSLPEDRVISEAGATFKNPHDNHRHQLTPEVSIATQQAIGSDIMMVLDVCIDSTSPFEATREAMERTHRWALRSLAAHQQRDTGQALFGIVQGGSFPELRDESAAFLTRQPFDGFAIGGLAVGEAREVLYAMCGHTAQQLPAGQPRYLMGVGTPIDLIECVARGVDMFDCILPTKMSQQGYAYTFEGQLKLSKTEYRFADVPLDASCDCSTCQRYSRAYVQHQVSGGHALGARLLGVHNLRHYQVLMKRLRDAIIAGRFEEEAQALRERVGPKSKVPVAVGNARQGDVEVVKLKTGERAIRHRGHGEVMHPVGPWEEANRLYAALVKPGARVLDLGLGAGANAVAALEKGAATVVSLESDLSAFELALREGFPYLERWQVAAQALLKEGSWEGRWSLRRGDAREQLEAHEEFDVIFHDPYSPANNGELWTVDWFRALRAHAADDAVLATYSAATSTRVAMLLGGWFVGAGASTGTRGETTVAATRLELLDKPLGERWLERWQRSSARAPHAVAFDEHVERGVRSHAQFNSGRSP